MTSAGCPFCSPEATSILFENEFVIALWDRFPVAPGHALAVTRRHVASWFEATDAERHALTAATIELRGLIQRSHQCDGFNIGINVGVAAGQTIPHLHLHLIPRREGDTSDPRGGVRHVIPEKGNYLQSFPDKHALLTTGGDDPLLPHLELDLARATRADIAVAFVMPSGVERIYSGLRALLLREGHLRLVTGDYQDITDPGALRILDDLRLAHSDQVKLRAFETEGRSFHPKSYIFHFKGGGGVAYVGSSNLSRSALEQGIEWNYRIITSRDHEGFQEVSRAFECLFEHPATVPLDATWIESYRGRRRFLPQRQDPVDLVPESPEAVPTPNTIQQAALAKLIETRAAGYKAGLVVLATGIGKTWLAAFDSMDPKFKRILFVAHREEILQQAMRTFRRIRPRGSFGFYDGNKKIPDADILFASIQTLGRRSHLNQFDRNAFDYVVVDEFHHASASTYRRLISHFEPRFLLGLTATPERTDGGDLLELCQENLVYRSDLREGIRAQLLSPFRYFGVPDDVDYQNIPWRNSRFSEEELTNALATQARARNAYEQWKKHGGKRTLAFCVSQRHADYMQAHFRAGGVETVAVHSGANSAPRTSSLEDLASGKLEVLFAVDMLNEGVDIPDIDTVMMLRPTESQILWLQQLGRGLRFREGKTLSVIDYIGNHRTFLLKAWTLLGVPVGDHAELAAALRRVQDHEFELPPGCEVTYDLEAINILRGLLRVPGQDAALRAFYEDFRDRNGIRPRAIEAFHENFDVRDTRRTSGSWMRFVEERGDLNETQRRVLGHFGDFVKALETTPMTRGYKMLVLLAMLNTDTLPGNGIRIEDLVAEFSRLTLRNPRLVDDAGEELGSDTQLRRLLERNPIPAWTDGMGTGNVSMFAYSNGVFRFRADVEQAERSSFQEIVRELAEWRLSEYVARKGSSSSHDRVIGRVGRSRDRPVLEFQEASRQRSFPPGWTPIVANGEQFETEFDDQAVYVVRKRGSEMNELPSIVRGWFGADAGLPGTEHSVVCESSESGYTISPLRAQDATYPELWRAYSREQIAPLFGERFSARQWQVGFVPIGKQVFLLNTLNKQGMAESHKYADRFLSPNLFEWQSQNRTTQAGIHGRLLRDHVASGVAVHLFIRKESKRADGRAAPFVYCGPVTFVDWEGEKPITIRWRLGAEVPKTMRALLGVPGNSE